MKKFFYLLLLIPLIAVPFTIDDSFACQINCTDEKGLRIMAGYDTKVWHGTNHHLTNYWGYAFEGADGFDAVTLSKYERSLKPHFMIKSISGGVTADYSVTYQMTNSDDKLMKTQTKHFEDVFFFSKYSGKKFSFPSIQGVGQHTTITYTLKITSLE